MPVHLQVGCMVWRIVGLVTSRSGMRMGISLLCAEFRGYYLTKKWGFWKLMGNCRVIYYHLGEVTVSRKTISKYRCNSQLRKCLAITTLVRMKRRDLQIRPILLNNKLLQPPVLTPPPPSTASRRFRKSISMSFPCFSSLPPSFSSAAYPKSPAKTS